MPPVLVSWSDAPQRLADAVRARAGDRAVTLVGITGPVGAGKSTLARALAGTVIATDDYLPDYAEVPFLERDDPRRADLPLLAEHLRALREGRSAEVPVWSFFTHRRESSRIVMPAPLIVVEGIHALDPMVRSGLDLAVFVEASREARWSRLEARERAGERGWTVDHLREHFEAVAEPSFARFEAVYRAGADVIVHNDPSAGQPPCAG